ncbi:hypothetical protein ACIQOV_37525, partial [Kitasatospora sp. NPDC091257]|uniref:hypothetical protein n=1 Tax=Kitasatospora sp. NPDC091257 TaxID=3364084 RepID=UPI003814C1DC
AGLLMRLGQDDVFGKDGLGWDKVAAVFNTAGGPKRTGLHYWKTSLTCAFLHAQIIGPSSVRQPPVSNRTPSAQ